MKYFETTEKHGSPFSKISRHAEFCIIFRGAHRILELCSRAENEEPTGFRVVKTYSKDALSMFSSLILVPRLSFSPPISNAVGAKPLTWTHHFRGG